MDYPCGKFGDCSFSHFGFIMRTDRQTDAAERLTPATVVGVSNNDKSTRIINIFASRDLSLRCAGTMVSGPPGSYRR